MVLQEHTPVMVGEVMRALNVQDSGTYVDATFGRGGHTRAILDRLGPEGRVLAIDRDPDSCEASRSLFPDENRLTVVHAPFSDLSKILNARNLAQRHRLGGVPFLLQTFGPYVQELGEGRHGGLRSAISAAPDFPRPLTRAVYPEGEVVLLVPGQPRPARLLFFRCPLFWGLCVQFSAAARSLPGSLLRRCLRCKVDTTIVTGSLLRELLLLAYRATSLSLVSLR